MFMDKNCEMTPCGRVGYAYVPVQIMNELYSPEVGLEKGTVFPELWIPMPEYSPMAN
ncbi:MAG: spore coat associated protein CotJA [Clostridia bacterium]|nr:spore coat associated protein CotJA [Clostridia bacterium]MBQ3554346.1 spore coat associated protein CotJA [Clostridia bacterium]